VVEGVVATYLFVEGNDDLVDVVLGHGFGHDDGSYLPKLLLPVPTAGLEVINTWTLGESAPLCLCELKALDGLHEVRQGLAGAHILLAIFVRKARPKDRRFAAFLEDGPNEVAVPVKQGGTVDGVLRLMAALCTVGIVLLARLCEAFLQSAKLLGTDITVKVVEAQSFRLNNLC